MPRKIHTKISHEQKREQILEAFRTLHAEGFDDCGPVDLARTINQPWTRVRGQPVSGALMPFIKALVEEGVLRRRAQGPKRGRYKLIEGI